MLTPEQCIGILENAGCDKDVITHCRAVSELAVEIALRIDGADVELVRAGGLLHDLGRARTHGIGHAVEGVKIAKELGLPDEITGIIRNHIGAGLPADEAAAMGLPSEEFMPVTIEQKIVAHADNMIDYFQPLPVSNVIHKLTEKGHLKAVERIKLLHDELSKLANIDIDELI
jgi:uncharacterized protein (TIGR00295 family)